MAEAKEMSFEKAMEKLEEILEKLEREDRDLEETIKLYEEGIRLSKHCSDRLESAKQKAKEMEHEG